MVVFVHTIKQPNENENGNEKANGNEDEKTDGKSAQSVCRSVFPPHRRGECIILINSRRDSINSDSISHISHRVNKKVTEYRMNGNNRKFGLIFLQKCAKR